MIEGSIVFNGQELNVRPRSTNTSPFWYSRVMQADGLFGGVDRRIEVYPRPQAAGTRKVDIFKSNRVMTLGGEIKGLNGSMLRIGQRTLEAAFWDDAEHDLVFELWGEPALVVKAYVTQDFVCVESNSSFDYVRQWAVQLTADDPRTYLASDGTTVFPSYMA